MARFRYSMQSILNIKMKMETQAKQEFSAARAALDREEERRAQELLAGALDVGKIEENRTAIQRMEDYIAEQRLRVAAAEKNLEQARIRLTEVMMERKTHETLKEKAFDAFLMEEKRQEGKEIDELTSYTYGQRRSAGK